MSNRTARACTRRYQVRDNGRLVQLLLLSNKHRKFPFAIEAVREDGADNFVINVINKQYHRNLFWKKEQAYLNLFSYL
jgi:hypothetical protein